MRSPSPGSGGKRQAASARRNAKSGRAGTSTPDAVIHVYAAISVRGTITLRNWLRKDVVMAKEGWQRASVNPFLMGY